MSHREDKSEYSASNHLDAAHAHRHAQRTVRAARTIRKVSLAQRIARALGLTTR